MFVIDLLAAILFITALVFAILYFLEREKRKSYLRAIDILRFLVRNNRISKDEYKAAVGDDPPTEKPALKSMQPIQSVQQVPIRQDVARPDLDKQIGETQQTTIPKEQPTVVAAPDMQAAVLDTRAFSDVPAAVAPIRKMKLKPNFALNIMLIIGVVFIILAGVLFATTQWIYLPPFLRTIVICSVSFVFFAASQVAERALKIRKTAVAFYIIGAFFLPTAVLTVGYFKMLGEYLSLQGEGSFFLFSTAFLVLGVACLIGSLKYKLTYFTECFLYCVTGTVIFLVGAFHPPAGIYILSLYIYAALLIILGLRAQKVQSRKSRFSHIIRRIPLFTILNSLLIASAGFFVPGVDASIGIASTILSPLFLTALFRGKKSYEGVFPFVFVLTAGLLRFGYGGELGHFLLLTLMSSTLITIVGCLTVLPDSMRKALRIIGSSMAGILFVIQFVEFVIVGEWNYLSLILVAGVAVNLFFGGYMEKSRIHLSLAMIPTITCLHGLATILAAMQAGLVYPVLQSVGISSGFGAYDLSAPVGANFAVLLTVLFFALLLLDRKVSFSPRTITSDTLILVAMFVAFLIDYVAYSHFSGSLNMTYHVSLFGCLCSLILFSLVLWVQALSGKNPILAGASAVSIPIVFFLMYVVIQLQLPQNTSWAPLFSVFFAVLSVGGLMAKYKAISDRRFRLIEYSSMGIFFLILPIINVLWAASTIAEVPVLLIIATGYLTGFLLIRTKYAQFSPNRLVHVMISAIWGLNLFSAVLAISQFWLGFTMMSMKLMVPIAAAIILVIVSYILRKRKISMGAFAHLLRISSIGLTIMTFLCTVSFNDAIPIQLAVVVYFIFVVSFVSQRLAGHAFISSWIEPLLVFGFTDYILHRAGLGTDQLIRSVVFSGIFIVLVVLGRLLYKRIFESTSDTSGREKYKLDWLTISSVLAPILLLEGNNLSWFFAWILFAVYSISFAGRIGGQTQSKLSASFAAAFVGIAIWSEPFLLLPHDVRLKLNLFIFIMYFVFLRFVIWKNKVNLLRICIPTSISISFLILAFYSARSNSLAYTSAFTVAAIFSFFLYFVGFLISSLHKDKKSLQGLSDNFIVIAWGTITYALVFIVTYDFMSIYSLYTNILILSVVALILLIAGFFLGRVYPSKEAFFTHLLKVGSYGLMLFSLLLVLFYAEVSTLFVIINIMFLLASHVGQRISGHAFVTSWLEPVLLLFLMTQWSNRLEGVDHQAVKIIIYAILFALMLGTGHLLHKRVFSKETGADFGNRYTVDWLSLSAMLAIFLLFFCGRWGIFTALFLLGTSMISFRARSTGEMSRKVFATLATSFYVFAIWAQPVISWPDVVVTEWNLMILVAGFIFLRWMVWRDKEKIMEALLFSLVILSILILSASALFSGELFDSLFMGISMFVLMCVSFLSRKKKWFILSSVTVICLSIYMTRTFWSSIEWWIYLLATGLIIIGLGTSNEIMKQRGDSLTGRAKKIFKDWE